jgi:mono/diheme cytochrome c family protein
VARTEGKRAGWGGAMLIPSGNGRPYKARGAPSGSEEGDEAVMRRYVGSTLCLAATMAVAPAAAQEKGNAEAGHELASKLCTSCHIVGNERSGSDLAPPFPLIAKNPRLSMEELHGWGGGGHPLLPDLALTPDQIAAINAYLDSLRGDAPSEEPDAEPRERDLPQVPPDRIGPPIGDQEEPD